MAERLGIVLYWIGCIMAGSWVLMGFWLWYAIDYEGRYVQLLAFVYLPALLLWLLGKGLRYIISGY